MNIPVWKWLFVACFTLSLAACNTPRGAALQSEVLKEADKDVPTFQVVEVTRARIPAISNWPATGGARGYNWLPLERGPGSQLIRAGDLVSITIWDSQDNSLLTAPGQKSVRMEDMRVSGSGSIFLPYVEEVVINGLTEDQARRRVQARYETVVPSAQVQLSARQGRSNTVSVVGGVSSPGPQVLDTRGVTILDVLAAAGGIRPDLRYPIVRLNRGDSSYRIPAERLFATPSANTVVRGSDRIVVEAVDETFTSLGATGAETLVAFPKDRITALEAISLAGGIQDNRADPKGILVLREYSPRHLRSDDGGPSMAQVIFTIDLTTADGLFAARNFEINPGDTVLATESPVTAARTILGLFGSVLGLSLQVSAAAN